MDDQCCTEGTVCTVPDKSETMKFDLAVIGAGSAGFSAAITAAGEGKQVALIGYGTIGGTCVNVGCVPSKTMIRAAESLRQSSVASRFSGIESQARVADWSALIAQKEQLVADLRQAKYMDLLPVYNNIAYIEGRAALADGGVTVDGKRIKADRVVIATGSSPSVPPIPGIDKVPYLTSTTALQLQVQPKSLIVMGGGYIGCELAQMFARMGTRVTIVFRSRLLPEAEPEISDALSDYFADEGISIIGGLSYNSVSHSEDGIALVVQKDGQDQTIVADHLLLTTGRHANTEGLELVPAGVAVLANGGIKVDDRMRTTKENIYAAGDVTGSDQFVYMAAYGAKIAAKNAINGNTAIYDNRAMPAVVFTDPQVASVGLTEAQAREIGIDVKISLLPLKNVPRALAARDTRGLIKLVADETTDKLIGAHILAPEGADSIQTAAIAIQQGMTVQELGDMIFPYLTTVEGLKLAAQTFDKDVKMLSCCAG
ncbi:MAG: mercury(II) reductase [Rhodospirillales bacterium]|nr:mercury(II) reductase [Rhodospirillales bacterium]